MGGRTKLELEQLAEQLLTHIQLVSQATKTLEAAALQMRATLDVGRDVFVSPVIGAGKWFFTSHDLTVEQLAELEEAVHAGHMVQVILDFVGGKYHVARVLSMANGQVLVAPWGVDEHNPKVRKTLANPKKDIWGWYIALLVDGV